MAIHGEAGYAERMAQHDVRGLASDAGQLHERSHVRGHFALVTLDERASCAHNRARFAAEKSRGDDHRLDGFGFDRGQRARIRIFLEERRRDDVDARIGGLRGKDRRDQQLERRTVMELGVGIRVLLLEPIEDGDGLGTRAWIGHGRRSRCQCTGPPGAAAPTLRSCS